MDSHQPDGCFSWSSAIESALEEEQRRFGDSFWKSHLVIGVCSRIRDYLMELELHHLRNFDDGTEAVRLCECERAAEEPGGNGRAGQSIHADKRSVSTRRRGRRPENDFGFHVRLVRFHYRTFQDLRFPKMSRGIFQISIRIHAMRGISQREKRFRKGNL